MEAQSPSTIDASSPFSSVKEAVAIFGERLRLPRETRESPSIPLELKAHTPSPKTKSPSLESEAIMMPNARQNIVHGNDLVMMLMVLKKLESEVQDTKKELNLFKSETQMAFASLHNNMPGVISAKAVEEGEAEKPRSSIMEGEVITRARSRGDNENNNTMVVKSIDSPTLAKILSVTCDYQRYNFREGKKANNKNKVMKMKPIVPLVTDIFPWKKSGLFSSREHM